MLNLLKPNYSRQVFHFDMFNFVCMHYVFVKKIYKLVSEICILHILLLCLTLDVL